MRQLLSILINKEEMRKKLNQVGAKLAKKETLMKRAVFYPPEHINKNKGYLRVRDEGVGKVTMTLKIQIDGAGIETERESEIEIKSSYEEGVKFLKNLGYKQKARQESLREIWEINNVEIMIDTWPFTETYVEIEGKSEQEVREVAEKLGFDWNKARFGASMAPIIEEKYGISQVEINNEIPEILFGDVNPFEEFRKKKYGK